MVRSGFGKLPQQLGRGCSPHGMPGDIGTVVMVHSAVPGAYLLVHRDRAQQVGVWEEQVGGGQGRVSDFSVPPRGRNTCSIRFEPSHAVGCLLTCPLGSSGEYLAQGAEHKRAKTSPE